MAHLGDSLASIAAEKAGVVMPGATVVSGVTEEEPARVIARVCADQEARLVRARVDVVAAASEVDGETTLQLTTPRRTYGPVRLALRGAHQVGNAIVAVRLLEALEEAGVGGGREAIETGLAEARWPGRIERLTLTNGTTVVLDGAHNPDGARALAAWLRSSGQAPATLVTACMHDKDVEGLLAPLLPLADRVVATAVPFPRALPAADLAQRVAALAPSMPIETATAPEDAMAIATGDAARVIVAGSLFLVGAVRPWLDAHAGPRDPA